MRVEHSTSIQPRSWQILKQRFIKVPAQVLKLFRKVSIHSTDSAKIHFSLLHKKHKKCGHLKSDSSMSWKKGNSPHQNTDCGSSGRNCSRDYQPISQGKRDERWYLRTEMCFKIRYTRRNHFLNDFFHQNSLSTFLKSKCIPSVKDPTLPSCSELGIPNDAMPAWNSQIKSRGILAGLPFFFVHVDIYTMSTAGWHFADEFPTSCIYHIQSIPGHSHPLHLWVKKRTGEGTMDKETGVTWTKALPCGIAIRFQITEIRGWRSEFKCQLDVLLRRWKYLTFRSAFCFPLTIWSQWKSHPHTMYPIT